MLLCFHAIRSQEHLRMMAYEDAGGSMCEARSGLEHRKAHSDVELTLKSAIL
jgi:hypothetical protein